MKLTRLQVHQYRAVPPGTELVFGPSLTLLLGQNGTGRTTLLELISTVLVSDFSGLLHEAFSLEYGLTMPGLELHIVARNTRPDTAPQAPAALVPLHAPRASRALEPLLEATLRLEAPGCWLRMRATAAGLFCEVDGQSAYARTMDWSPLDRSVWTLLFMTAQYLERELKERLKEFLRRTFLLAPWRFDEALGTFGRIGDSRFALEMRNDEVFPLGLMALPTWMPGWLRGHVERGPLADALELRHDELAQSFLAKFVALAGFTSGQLRVEVLDKRSYENGGRVGFGQFTFHFTRPDGTSLTQDALGYGQKRLLAFLYYLDVHEDFVIADELPNGLHPRWAEACLQELGPRQSFLTSQNPLLPGHVAFGSAEELHASLVLCRTGLRWENPSRALAGQLFAASQQGTRPVGELLREFGLW
jgi:energy-coupling factor transporter ATP-binding protein EcfA2